MDQPAHSEHDSTVSLWSSLEQELGLSGRFAIVSRIGAGGTAEVFKARQIPIERQVAIKVLVSDLQGNTDAKLRFQREAKILSTLEHPNIPKLYSFGASGERLYQIMDYLEGTSLSTRLERGPLTVTEFKNIFSQIISALRYASTQGLVHRDVKPSNIFLTQDVDGSTRAMLLDFGLVRQLSAADGTQTITATQAVIGSPPYMSPEQCRGHTVGSSSDVYSLGCTMYEALTGNPPFHSDNVAEIMLQHMNQVPQPLQAFQDSIPVESALPEFIHRCLSKEPSARYASFQELEEAFNLAVHSSSSTARYTPEPSQPARKKRRAIAIACAYACACTVVVAGLVVNKLCDKPSPPFKISSVKPSEREKLEKIRECKQNLADALAPLRRARLEELVLSYMNLADYYQETDKPRLKDAEKFCDEAVQANTKYTPSKKSLAMVNNGLSKLSASKARETSEPAKRFQLLSQAEQYSKLAIEQIAQEVSVLKAECLMQYSLVLLQAQKYQEAAQQVDAALACGLALSAHSPMRAEYAHSYASQIQNTIAKSGKNASSTDKLQFCRIFLAICDFIGPLRTDDPALKYAHKWFNLGRVADKEELIDGTTVQQLEEQLKQLDENASSAEASHEVPSPSRIRVQR